MGLSSFFNGIQNFIKVNFITRLTNIMLKGTLGQKVAIVIGGLGVLFGIYRTFQWLLLILAGYIIIFLAFKDFDNMTKTSND